MKFDSCNVLALLSVLIIVRIASSNTQASSVEGKKNKQREINLPSLLLSYVLVCGYDYQCNVSNIPIPIYLSRSFVHLELCPSCFCDDECFHRGDCCPDVYFRFPLQTCNSVDIITVDPEASSPPTYLLTSTCPVGSNDKISEKCQSNVTLAEKLLLSPVTSTAGVPITYLNQFCAECNGETEFVTWDLDISCLQFADFNFLSSYQSIIDLALKRSCNITFNPIPGKKYICNDTEPEDVYASCNVTGTWLKYDPDVDTACSSFYQNKYGIFKNIFCFICNPEKTYESNIVSQCNETGMWSKYDHHLENACLNLPHTEATKPFRNIFCFLCNVDDLPYHRYIDAESIIHTSANIRLSQFAYTVSILRFNLPYLVDQLIKSAQNLDVFYTYEANENDLSRSIIREQNVNMTNLLLASSTFNHKGFCDSNFPLSGNTNVSLQMCTCEPICRKSCCNDFALTYPVSCINDYVNRKAKFRKFLVIDGCYKKEYINIFKDLCSVSQSSSSNIFEYLPLNVARVSYKNLFCLFCNTRNISATLQNLPELQPLIKPWNITIECESFINFQHRLFLFDIIEMANKMSCNISYIPNLYNTTRCGYESPFKIVSNCNTTGRWRKLDPDVKWACEETETYRLPSVTTISGERYKNEYCFMCNSDVPNLISTCNMTGKWTVFGGPMYGEALKCLTKPTAYNKFPYKNNFCWICNKPIFPGGPITDTVPPQPSPSPTTSTITTYKVKTSTTAVISPILPGVTTFRSLFALGQYKKFIVAPEVKKTCSDVEFYDEVQKKCRNLTCFPGKLLHDEECKPLMASTKNLRYILEFRMTGSNLCDMSVNESLHFIGYTLITTLVSRLGMQRSDVGLEEFRLLANRPCNDDLSLDCPDLQVNIYLKIFIISLVPRLKTEISLMNFTFSRFNISTSDGVTWTMEAEPMEYGLVMSSKLNDSTTYVTECLLSLPVDGYTVLYQEKYRAAYVRNTLTCEQVMFSPKDLIVNESGMTIELLPFGVTIEYDDFLIMPDGKARVCLDRISQYMRKKVTVVQTRLSPLALLTRICLAVSMLSLLATFLTFCLLPQLRTLPGKNNMALMVSLFLAHLSFFIIDQAKVKTLECKVIGILAHYFWLCVFGNFNSCSFHMYKVFSGGFRSVSRNTNINKIVFKMSLFSFGLPFILVNANVFLTMAVTRGQSIGYGENKCFITFKEAFIVTLLFPMALMGVGSIFCFSYTAYIIKNRPNIKKSKTDQLEFFVYLKLFVVTGSTWIFQIIDTFLPISFLSYIIAVLNGLQGLFLFLSYVCTKRVFLMYKEMCSKSDGNRTTTSNTGGDSGKQQDPQGEVITESTRI